MRFSFRIGKIITNGVTQNGNIDIGSTVQNSHTANTKSVGAVVAFGDCSDACAYMINFNEDNDENDMGQSEGQDDQQK
ncbi:spore germination protein [Fictibacillus sp. WQ 8-8]|uniref:Spore germination protein n=1 Tax=Fictibacillus marinisediminis TaxID=2878389 RepID=A0A9X1X843_9BACL|nr:MULTISPECIES: spore germination protein [Fictibacillus]SFE52710.1 Spore germination protein gerPA/gerPF [Bacillus sp. OV194]MCK6255681.1 spore germination protein [Fictibacillus marinisediminis]MCQ6267487.1 spore germination protein [Fictibacillus sp. WQ 8-8]MED2973026.1 spore germination protein [Fictibacillus sp. B-59209]UZJ78387.1 spore germination protein [Fictibacillus sp. KU28468]